MWVLNYNASTTLFFFELLPLGFPTNNHLHQSHPIPSILLWHTSPLHTLLHYIHESSLYSSSFPPAFCHPLFPLTTISPLQIPTVSTSSLYSIFAISIISASSLSTYQPFPLYLKSLVSPLHTCLHFSFYGKHPSSWFIQDWDWH